MRQAGRQAVMCACRRPVVSGTGLRLVVTAPVVRRVLSLNGLDRLAGVYPSAGAARTRTYARRRPGPISRGGGMLLAEHYTPVHRGRLTATTLETVTFDRPHRITFRLVRGPVPHVTEEFTLTEPHHVTTLAYTGQIGADSGPAGRWWASRVAVPWEAAVRASLTSIKTEAERRARPGAS